MLWNMEFGIMVQSSTFNIPVGMELIMELVMELSQSLL